MDRRHQAVALATAAYAAEAPEAGARIHRRELAKRRRRTSSLPSPFRTGEGRNSTPDFAMPDLAAAASLSAAEVSHATAFDDQIISQLKRLKVSPLSESQRKRRRQQRQREFRTKVKLALVAQNKNKEGDRKKVLVAPARLLAAQGVQTIANVQDLESSRSPNSSSPTDFSKCCKDFASFSIRESESSCSFAFSTRRERPESADDDGDDREEGQEEDTIADDLDYALSACDNPTLSHPRSSKIRSSTCALQAKEYDDISVNDLAGYLEDSIVFPKKMSYMAEMMYT